jgi:hypothetical protein
MATITVHSPARIDAPRAASVVADWFSRLLATLRSGLHAHVEQCSADDRVGEASRLRRFAQQVMADDPRFASDLFAAADRHERS